MQPTSRIYDVIVVGELNIDLILNQLNEMPVPGREIFAGQMSLTLGSSAAILASNLSSFGMRVAFIGKIGTDLFGQVVLDHLEKAGVYSDMIIRDSNLTTGASIGLHYNGDRGMVTYAGAMTEFSIADIPLERLQEAKHLHFSSYFFQPGIQQQLVQLFSAAKKMGLTTSFDMQTDPNHRWEIDYAAILPYVDIFFPNENELLQITRKPALEDAVDEISRLVPVLALKLGERGSMTVHNGERYTQQAFYAGTVIDAIGAGDSFNAGFLYKYLTNAPIPECQAYGNIAGAISTTAPGGTSAFHEQKSLDQHAKEKFGFTGSGVT